MQTEDEYLGPHIDVHVHFRDWAQAKVYTIREGMELARSQKVTAVCDMPNTNPPMTTEALIKKRFETASSEGVNAGYYVYIGATSDPKQLEEAFGVATDHPKVVGVKLYAGRSVGNLAVLPIEAQRQVYTVAGKVGYKGVIAVHSEEEACACEVAWNPERPATWNCAKPPVMEIVGVGNQIMFAKQENFKGHLHIAHTSTPDAVRLVYKAKGFMSISCGVTPHHLTRSTDIDMETTRGMAFKVNPPIRSKAMQTELRTLLREGMIDLIETDHAPHLIETKVFVPGLPKEFYMSGIRSLEGYRGFIKDLHRDGVSKEQIIGLTYTHPKKIFAKIKE